MIRIAVCDDEREIIDILAEIMQEENKKNYYNTFIEKYQNEWEFTDAFEKGKYFDLVLMDIEYGKENGIKLAHRIKEKNPDTKIIFITNHNECIYEAIKVTIEDFIDKSRIQEFIESYRKVLDRLMLMEMEMFEFQMNRKYVKIFIKDILYFMSEKRYIFLKTREGGNIKEYKFIKKLDSVVEEIEKLCAVNQFIRISKSYLINYAYVRRHGFDEIELYTDETFKITENYRKQAGQKFLELRR